MENQYCKIYNVNIQNLCILCAIKKLNDRNKNYKEYHS